MRTVDVIEDVIDNVTVTYWSKRVAAGVMRVKFVVLIFIIFDLTYSGHENLTHGIAHIN